MRAFLFTLALLFCSPVAAQNDTSNPIIARMASFVQAYNAQDITAIQAHYSTNAILMPPGQGFVIGREKIGQHYADAFAAGAKNLQFKTFDIRATDKLAVETGETVVMVGTTRIVGRYMHVWEVVEGQVLLTRDMYHVLKTE